MTWHLNQHEATADAGTIRCEHIDIFGFESLLDWTVSVGDTALSDNHTQGTYSMAIDPSNYTTVTSVPINWSGPLGTITFDIMLPTYQPNPWWHGDVQLIVNAPSAGLHNAYVGINLLTGLELGTWHTVSFDVPSGIDSALSGRDVSDFSFTIVVNVPPESDIHLLDNMTVGG